MPSHKQTLTAQALQLAYAAIRVLKDSGWKAGNKAVRDGSEVALRKVARGARDLRKLKSAGGRQSAVHLAGIISGLAEAIVDFLDAVRPDT